MPVKKRTDAVAAELLQATAEPVIDRRAREGDRAVLCRLKSEVGLLVAEQAFDLKAVRSLERDVDDGAERHRAVEIHRLIGDQLEEVTAEPVAAEGRDLHALRVRRRRPAERATPGPRSPRRTTTGSVWSRSRIASRPLVLAGRLQLVDHLLHLIAPLEHGLDAVLVHPVADRAW